jgi:hypothetical protein
LEPLAETSRDATTRVSGTARAATQFIKQNLFLLSIDGACWAVVNFGNLTETDLRAPFDAEWQLRGQVGVGDGDMDEELSGLFREWLSAFEAMQVASSDAEIEKTQKILTDIEARVAATPAEGLQGLSVKLGLHCFLNDHADAASAQSDSAYRDIVRLTGHDPAIEISTRFEKKAA